MTKEQSVANPPSFWSWSLKAYDRAGVAEMILNLQDEFCLNVNMVLWCLWAGEYYPGIDENDISILLKSTKEWQQRVTIPLRSIRKDMKKMNSTLSKIGIKSLRQNVKDLELLAERMEQNHLDEQTVHLARKHMSLKSTPCHAAYMEIYWRIAGGLELPDGLGLEDRAERVKTLFLKAQNVIFQKEFIQQDV